MLILVTTFKPFTDPFISMIQENAIKSWKMLNGIRKIIVYGDEIGFENICDKYNLIHEWNIGVEKTGVIEGPTVPTIKGLFKAGLKYKKNSDYVCYTNGDVIYLQEWIDNIEAFRENDLSKYPYFLLLGRRFDWMKPQFINFEDFNQDIADFCIHKYGKFHPKVGIEYMVFSSLGTFYEEGKMDIPHLAVGSPGWDLLLLSNAIRKEMVVDLSETTRFSVIHQEHSRTHHRDAGENFDNNMKQYRKKLKEFKQKYGVAIDMNIANYESYYKDNKICFRKKENPLI